MSDHTPYNLPHGNVDPQRVFKRQNDSKTLPHYQSVSVAVGEKLPCQKEELTRGSVRSCGDDRRVDHRSRNVSAVCSMLLRQISKFSVNLLDLRLEETVLDSSARNF